MTVDRLVTRRYITPAGALGAVPVQVGRTGLALGRLQDNSLALVRLFRPRPVRVAMVSGRAQARLLVFRALALGARVVVRTTSPEHWNGLGEWATGRAERVLLEPADGPVNALAAGAAQPVLHVLDLGEDGPVAATPAEAWHTRLTVLPRLGGGAMHEFTEADFVLLRRLSPDEAAVAGTWLRLPAPAADLLGQLNADMLGVVGADEVRYVWLAATSTERRHLGLPATVTAVGSLRADLRDPAVEAADPGGQRNH